MYKLTALAAMAFLTSSLCAKQNNIMVTPVDTGVINKEQILYWLEKRNLVDKDASPEAKAQAVSNYIGKVNNQYTKKIDLQIRKKEQQIKQRLRALGREKEATQVKVLGLLIDFPDLPNDNNRLTKNDTSMYYADYHVDHYQQLMFSDNGYEGPSAQTLESARQFYKQESGDSFFLTGQVYDWVTADNNAAHYGAHDTVDGNDTKDKNVPALVLEAVTKAVQQHNIDLSQYDFSNPYGVVPGGTDQPDGIVDHLMLFHSSVGEEAGGGVLGDDAIWSHQFYAFDEQNQPLVVPGTQHRIYKYTICPIDAASGVVVHEFGHDLGLPDEYDTGGDLVGEPVAAWSVMSSGSWTGSPAGTKPVSFSPWARDFLQNKFGGNWINQQVIDATDLSKTQLNINLVDAVTHNESVNQVKVILPVQQEAFYAPYAGQKQYFSGSKNEYTATYTVDVTIPQAATVNLGMKAHWSIEKDFDYVVIKINGENIPSNYSQVQNSEHPSIAHTITSNSRDLAGAEGEAGWVNLNADLSAYAGQNVTLELAYVTDLFVTEYGFVFDDLQITADSGTIYIDNGETQSDASLNNFAKIGSTIDGASHSYYIQLRSYRGTDSGLEAKSYVPGVLLWYRNDKWTNNKVGEHPGEGFIGVVDADQNSITSSVGNPVESYVQVRDAAFSLKDQKAGLGDAHLSANPVFDDKNDYSAPDNPQAGLKLPKLGLRMEVLSEQADHSMASIALSRDAEPAVSPVVNGLTVTFKVTELVLGDNDAVVWDFGDGNTSTLKEPTHTYAQAGAYDVSVIVTPAVGDVVELSYQIMVSEQLGNLVVMAQTQSQNQFAFNVNFSGGQSPFTYAWDFGDGNTSTEQAPVHTYAYSGDYAVKVTVTDNQGVSVTSQVESVSAEVALNVNASRSVSDLKVSFLSAITGGSGSYTYQWTFGDGATSTQANPVHTYESAGSYDVSLVVTDTLGATQTFELSVTVSEAVVPPATSSSSGGSLAWLLLCLPVMLIRRR